MPSERRSFSKELDHGTQINIMVTCTTIVMKIPLAHANIDSSTIHLYYNSMKTPPADDSSLQVAVRNSTPQALTPNRKPFNIIFHIIMIIRTTTVSLPPVQKARLLRRPPVLKKFEVIDFQPPAQNNGYLILDLFIFLIIKFQA